MVVRRGSRSDLNGPDVKKLHGLKVKTPNKANQHGSLKSLRKKHATILTPSYWRR